MAKEALHQASKEDCRNADRKRNKLDWLRCHVALLNKSPEQHQSLWANQLNPILTINSPSVWPERQGPQAQQAVWAMAE